jgi:DUF1680 family protein
MPVERVYAHPSVRMDAGRAALKRGPLVYCTEQVDNPGLEIRHLRLPRSASISAVERPDLFGGTVALVAAGATAVANEGSDSLYLSSPPRTHPARFTALPYYLWNNRAPGAMEVWLTES